MRGIKGEMYFSAKSENNLFVVCWTSIVVMLSSLPGFFFFFLLPLEGAVTVNLL